MELIDLLALPFIQRSIIAGILASVVCGLIGMLTVLRGSSLYGDALAHASLAGVATALLLGLSPILGAFSYALIVAAVLTLIKHESHLSVDNLIALILPFSMGLAVILLSSFSGYQPELVSYLFGSLLAVSWFEVVLLFIVTIISLGVFWKYKNQLLFVFYDEDYAQLVGIKIFKVQFIYNLLLAVTVVTSIQVVGVILVNALLIIPTSIVRLFARSMTSVILLTPLVSIVITLIGICFSFWLDVPTGPAIAVVAGILFFMSWIGKWLVNRL